MQLTLKQWGNSSGIRFTKEFMRRAGIKRRIRPYDLRHAFATYALAHGADIGAVSRIMGHTDASMILRVYQHVQETQKRQAVEAAPDFLDMTAQFAMRMGI